MAAIATLRAKNQYAELDAADVRAIAYSDDTINMLGALILHIDDEGWAIGWDIRSALAVRGIEVSGAELKQQVSHLNPNRWYRVDDVANQLAVKRFN
jgi:hypothetical protein